MFHQPASLSLRNPWREAGGVTVVRGAEAAAAGTGGAKELRPATVEAEVTEVPGRVSLQAEARPAEGDLAKGSSADGDHAKAAQENAGCADGSPSRRRRQAAEPKAAPALRPPRPPRTRSQEKATGTRDFDRTGNVRLLPDTGGAARAASARADAAVPAPAASEPPSARRTAAAAGAGEATGTAAASGTTAEAGASEAPLPNYGELSVASLRARLRNLDIGQVRELAGTRRRTRAG